jgi:outer membrane protein TolC
MRIPDLVGLTPVAAALVCGALSGCASYEALPLPQKAELAPGVAELRHDTVPLDAKLTVNDIARLALLNNPDLRATRAQHGVAAAQLYQSGLLPNPSVAGSILPLVAGPGTTHAWNAAISYDVRSLITLSARRKGARATARQVDAQIVWQEWQTMGQSRLLAVDLIEGERSRRIILQTYDLLAGRVRSAQHALATGDATIATVAPDVAALDATRTQLDSLDRLQLSRRHQLAALLGLVPDAPLPLAGQPDLPRLDPDEVRRELPTLADRRPDIVALRLGYAAENAKMRAAILAQFPNLTFGITGGSDNSNVRNIGPQIALELPVFDHNQGSIAIETATRQQLHQEYAARLATAHGQVLAMLTETGLLTGQLEQARRDLSETVQVADQADRAFTAGNIDEQGYVDLVSARLIKEQEVVAIEQSLMEQRVAIATLIGAGMPEFSLPSAALGV